LDSKKFIPVIQNKINQDMNGNEITIEGLNLVWHGFRHPVALNISDAIIKTEKGAFFYGSKIMVDFSPLDLVFGRLKIEDIDVDQMNLSLTRTSEGQLQITGQASQLDEDKDEIIPEFLTLNNVLYDLPDLQKLTINEAQ